LTQRRLKLLHVAHGAGVGLQDLLSAREPTRATAEGQLVPELVFRLGQPLRGRRTAEPDIDALGESDRRSERGGLTVSANKAKSQLSKGFATSLLNPRGMMIYIAILPQLMDKHSSVKMQAAILSATFIFWCAVIYTIIVFSVSSMGSKVALSDTRRGIVDGCAGGMILMAAGFLAAA
jgi:hypothetical protein